MAYLDAVRHADHIGDIEDKLLERQIQAEQYFSKQSRQVQKAITALREIHQLFPEDVAAICAALSNKLAKDTNNHLKLHVMAVDSLDEIHNYIHDHILEGVL